MMQQWRFRSRPGQGLIEYGLIIFLVAVLVIASLMLLGPSVGRTFSGISNTV